jgi:hypothetical protein
MLNMAATLTKVSAAPHALKYSYVADGSDTVIKTQTQLVADCAAGPLKELLRKSYSPAAWTALCEGTLFSVYLTLLPPTSTGPVTPNPVAVFDTFGPDNLMRISIGAAVSRLLVELRFNHSIDR